MSEFDQSFSTFEQWVAKASSWLMRRSENVKAVCFDMKGRHCANGGDFQRARDESAFPVRWLWPDQIAEMAVHSKEERREAQAEIDWLRAALRLVADRYADLLEKGFPKSSRSNDDQDAHLGWNDDNLAAVQGAYAALAGVSLEEWRSVHPGLFVPSPGEVRLDPGPRDDAPNP